MLSNLAPTVISQGTIISSCFASEYQHNSVFGMIITARCDVEHSKVPIYNYLPIVGLEDWFLRHGVEILAERLIASCRGTLRSCLQRTDRSIDLLNFISHFEIADELKKDQSKAGTKIYQQFWDALNLSQECQAIFESSNLQARGELIRKSEKQSRGVLTELTNNRIADFHYLPRVQFDENPSGYVVNLREVRHISAQTAELVSHGLDPNEYDPHSKIGKMILEELDFTHEAHSFALPISQVRSPFIELILQRFSNVFARIGVEDLKEDEVRQSNHTLDTILEHSA